MDNPLLSRFAIACGVVHPLELVVEREDGVVIANGLLDQPFAILGRESYCDIQLNNPAVCPRHAFLQVIGGHVFVGDLGSRTGLHWNHGQFPYGWLVHGEPIQIGPYRLYLTNPVSPHPVDFRPSFHPLSPTGDIPPDFTEALLEFRNGRAIQPTWEVNRVMTLIGRSPDCKINLSGDDISLFHCYLLRTTDGLWVVDLFGRGGVKVNGQFTRLARLEHDDEIQVGQFVIASQYRVPGPSESGRICFDVSGESPPNPVHDLDQDSRVHTNHTPTALHYPPIRSLLGLSNSTDMMRPQPTMDGQGNSQTPLTDEELEAAVYELPRTDPPAERQVPSALVPRSQSPAQNIDPGLIPFLQQIGEMQGQMFAQFQQTMFLMMQMFGQMHRESVGTVQSELNRMAELNGEMLKLQTELSQAILAPPTAAAKEPAFENPLPPPESVPAMSEETAAQHHEVWARMERLNAERQSIWQRLRGAINQ